MAFTPQSIVICLLTSCMVSFILGCQNPTNSAVKETPVPQEAQPVETKPPVEVDTKNYPLPQWPEKAKQEKGRLAPFDEGRGDAAFNSFRQKLYNAVQRKDVAYILSVVPDISSIPPDVDLEKANFMAAFQLDKNPDNPIFWKELARCLELGGVFKTYDNVRLFFAPYIFVLDDFHNPHEEGVIIGENVRLREKGDSKSKILGSLTWDHYDWIREKGLASSETINGETHAWIKVKTKKGEEGYVYGKYTRSPVDFRAGFTEISPGEWQMTIFTAGD